MKRNLISTTQRFCIARKGFLVVDGTHDTQLRVHRGKVWLTQDGDRRDVVLGPAESIRLARKKRALVQGLAETELSLTYIPKE
jgi:hypothetical protein